MKTTMKLFTYGLLIFTLVFTSCSKDGDTGPAGTSGTDGTDGIDGTDGADGVNGTDGIDGADGNANVEVTVFMNPTWSAAGLMILDVPEITQEVSDYYLVLGFLQEGNDAWYSANGNQAVGGYYKGYHSLERYSIRAYDFDDVIDQTRPVIQAAKVVIIEPSNVILKSGNGKSANTLSSFRENTLTDLLAAGIDINDYNAVLDYFNISE